MLTGHFARGVDVAENTLLAIARTANQKSEEC
jgi:hypothetical protein